MSGLLTRLASRATGSAPVLRADAGLAGFSSSGGGFMAGEGDLAPAAAARARAREQDWSAPAVPPAQVSAAGVLPSLQRPPPAATAAAAVTATAAAAAATRATASPYQHASLAPLADAAPPAAATPPQLLSARMSAAPPAPPATSASTAAPAPERADTDDRFSTAEFTAALLPDDIQSGATGVLPAHARMPATPPGQTAEPGGDPAPLMGQGPRPAPLAALAPRASAPSPGTAAQPDPGDTEVHIHIGRIDVTAMPEAPSPRRSEPKVQAPLSLDAYLAQRGRS